MAAKFMICIDYVGKRLVIAHKLKDKSVKVGIQGNFGMLF